MCNNKNDSYFWRNNIMAKFISFEVLKFADGNGWRLLDISVNIDNISIVRKSDIGHTFSKYDMDTGTTKTFDSYPCTVLVTYDGIELTVLGSYEDTLSKINGGIK